MNRTIFREYDIRGIADRDLPDDVVQTIAKAFATRLSKKSLKKLAIGRDCRLSSDRIAAALLEGLRSTGADITDLGVVPTPVFYYALYKLPVEGGVMITGSHNAAEYNGFKLCDGKSALYGEQIQELYELAERGDFAVGRGTVRSYDLLPEYKKMITEKVQLSRPVRAVVDCGNGTACVVAPDALRAIGADVVELYCEMDGNFPNHHPDPTVEKNVEELKKRVVEEKAEVGIAYDGDADRIGVVDETGRVMWGDRLMILFAREILARKPGATIIGEVKCSKTLYDDIEKRGGRAIMWRTGHSLIKAKLKEEHAALAGEMSGHIFFADGFFGFDDAIYASARLLQILDQQRRPLSTQLSDVPKTVSTPEIRVDCADDVKFKIVERAQKYFSSKYKTVTVDGVRILFDDSWGLVRASNTQPALVLRFEAPNQERLDEIRAIVEGKLAEFEKQGSEK
ncbi:MAG: phosphomannomutase/phosphoglucomutase [Acidobacteriota bacterium]